MLAQSNNHGECMYALKRLAQEIAEMDEYERLKTLEWVINLEVEGRGNRFWILIVKCLLGKPELLPSAIKLAERELSSQSDIHGGLAAKSNIKYVNFGDGFTRGQLNTNGQNSSFLRSFFSPNELA